MTSSQPNQIEIGQLTPGIQAVENALENDGYNVLIADLGVAMPWTKLPIISYIVDLVVQHYLNLLLTDLFRAGFAAYVAIRTHRQVSDYYQAQTIGSVSGIDAAGDALIHLGG